MMFSLLVIDLLISFVFMNYWENTTNQVHSECGFSKANSTAKRLIVIIPLTKSIHRYCCLISRIRAWIRQSASFFELTTLSLTWLHHVITRFRFVLIYFTAHSILAANKCIIIFHHSITNFSSKTTHLLYRMRRHKQLHKSWRYNV